MRVILDTNILVAALITRGTPPDLLYEAWRDGRFGLFTSEPQVEELRRVTRREGIRFRIHPAEAGRMVNDLRRLATTIADLPVVEVSPDPYDNVLLAMAQAAQTEVLVTGDKRGLLALGRHGGDADRDCAEGPRRPGALNVHPGRSGRNSRRRRSSRPPGSPGARPPCPAPPPARLPAERRFGFPSSS